MQDLEFVQNQSSLLVGVLCPFLKIHIVFNLM